MRTAFALVLLHAVPAVAQMRPSEPAGFDVSDRERIALANVGLTSAFTLARGIAEGRVRTVRDGVEVAAWGAVAGAGFYAAKDQVGRGRGALGLGLAFASASLAENAAVGGGVAGHVRAGFGPVDLRVRTPLATRPGPALGVEVDPLGAVALVAVPLTGGRPVVRGGALVHLHPALLRDWRGGASGSTAGRVIVVDKLQDPILRHEAVHLVQGLQASAATPYGRLGDLWRGGRRTSAGGAVQWDVRTDWLTAALGGLSLALAGDGQPWPEVEAYELDSPPSPPYGPYGGGYVPTPCLPRPPDIVCNLR